MKTWQLQEAKANFSKVVKEVMENGPQQVSLRGEPAVVIITKDAYERFIQPQPTLIEFLTNSPLTQEKLTLKRDKSLTRKVTL